nr:hypothetical protein [Kofleriaceae bacterium]
MVKRLVLACSVLVAGLAQAKPTPDENRDSLAILAKELQPVGADPGRDTAPLRTPPWCGELTTKPKDITKDTISGELSGIPRVLSSPAWVSDFNAAIQIAIHACEWPDQPALQQAAQILLQEWIDITGLSLDDALATFESHLHTTEMAADRRTLCAALGTDTPKLRLFGCTPNDAPAPPLWIKQGNNIDKAAGASGDDVSVLAWALDASHYGFAGKVTDRDLCYADPATFSRFHADGVRKQLDAAPYKGNRFARATILESLGRVQQSIATFTAMVDAKKGSLKCKSYQR